jgi:hypothetical protein
MPWTSDDLLPRRVDDAVDVEVNDTRLVYHVDTDQTYLLNATAAVIYDQLDGRLTLSQLAAELSAISGVSSEVIVSDVSTLLDSFDLTGLLASTSSATQACDERVPGRWMVDPPGNCDIQCLYSWAPAFTVEVDGVQIGIQTTDELDDALRQAMAPIMVRGVPKRVSLSLHPGRQDGELHRLFWGNCPAVSTLDPGRLAASFIAHLGCSRSPEGVLRTFLTTILREDGSVVLFPPMRGVVPFFEARLRAAGAIVSDWPWADVELDAAAGPVLVVSDPEFPAEVSRSIVDVLNALPGGRSEQRIPAGRYPISRLALMDDWTMGEALYALFTQLPQRSASGLRILSQLLATVPTVRITGEPADVVTATLGHT